jgi:predicted O-methyltransferase YrrM
MFDLIFIDADKEHYLDYYLLVFDKLRSGGFLLADNAFWDGKVITEPSGNDPETRGIIEFNELVQNDSRVENMIIPLRDGIMMVRKI